MARIFFRNSQLFHERKKNTFWYNIFMLNTSLKSSAHREHQSVNAAKQKCTVSADSFRSWRVTHGNNRAVFLRMKNIARRFTAYSASPIKVLLCLINQSSHPLALGVIILHPFHSPCLI